MNACIRASTAILNWTPIQTICQPATHVSEPKMGLCYDVLSRDHMATEAYKQAWKTLLECRDMDLSRNAGAPSTPERPVVDEKEADTTARVHTSAAQLLDATGMYAQYFRVVRKHTTVRRKGYLTEMICIPQEEPMVSDLPSLSDCAACLCAFLHKITTGRSIPRHQS